jgi:hypothetical protein
MAEKERKGRKEYQRKKETKNKEMKKKHILACYFSPKLEEPAALVDWTSGYLYLVTVLSQDRQVRPISSLSLSSLPVSQGV